VLSPDFGELWREVPLRIVVVNGALPLAAGDIPRIRPITDGEARCQRGALGIGNNCVVGGGQPSLVMSKPARIGPRM